MQNFYGTLQRQSYYVCTEDSKSSFEYVIHLCLSGYLFLLKFMSFPSNSESVERCSSCAVVQFKDVNSSIAKQVNAFAWMIGLWIRVMVFEHLSLVHMCRMLERRAHRKEFRRKGC